MNKFFKNLVLVCIVTTVIFNILPYFWHLIHPEETLNLLLINGFKEYINFYYINNALAVINILALIGLLFFKKWSRTLFFTVTCISILLGPFQGFSITAGYETSIGYISVLCEGAILYMAYFSSVASEFNKNV